MDNLMSDGSVGGANGEATPQSPSSSQQAPSNGSQNGGSTQVYSLNDDSMIQVPGEKEAVKYKDYVARFVPKSDFTKVTQQRAEELKQARAEIQRLQTGQRQPQQPTQPQTNPIDKMLGDLQTKPYVSGADAANMIKQVWDGGIQNLAKAIGQRDEVIKLLYQRLMSIDKSVSGLNGRTQQNDFSQKLASVKQSLSLPDDPQIDEFLQDVYLSHEGEDLDREFPNLVRARWDALQKLVRVVDQKRAQDARRNTLGMPGKGGNASPSRPLRQGFKSAKDTADDLWNALQGGQS